MIDRPAPPIPAPAARAAPPPGQAPDREDALMEAARALETSFLAEMLGAAGMGRTREAMGGGAGEDAFGSLLVREQAQAMTRAGGIGLAESIFETLLAREGGEGPATAKGGAGR